MDEQLTALVKEVRDLRERQLQDRHESILRDDAIFRRIGTHDERMDFHAETLQKTIAAVGQSADTVISLGHKIDLFVDRMGVTGNKLDALIVRMDKTDQRWNQ